MEHCTFLSFPLYCIYRFLSDANTTMPNVASFDMCDAGLTFGSDALAVEVVLIFAILIDRGVRVAEGQKPLNHFQPLFQLPTHFDCCDILIALLPNKQ